MRIYLIGYMGSGKTFVGKKLAKNLNYAFVDLDTLFEEKYKISIDQFFNKYGEKHFREIEHQLLNDTFLDDNIVIATGGGTPCFYDNIDLMNKNGLTIYLKLTTDQLFERLSKAKKPRPLIKQIQKNILREFVQQQITVRERFYKKAQLIHQFTENSADILAERLSKNIYKSN